MSFAAKLIVTAPVTPRAAERGRPASSFAAGWASFAATPFRGGSGP